MHEVEQRHDAGSGASPRAAPYRLPLLAVGFLALGGGVLAGLARLGWDLRLPGAGLVAWHGALMVSGFFGTLISLERAVALRTPWSYLAPLAGALGAIALLSGTSNLAGALLGLAAAVLTLASGAVLLRQRALFNLTLVLGAASWLVGNLLWLGGSGTGAVLPWWAGFLVLTIAGERLELSRFLPRAPAAQPLFVAAGVLLIAGMAAASWGGYAGPFFLALAALAAWLWRHDIARRTIRGPGFTRFVAACLLSGYVWLALAGLLGLGLGGFAGAGPSHDAVVHALFLGFVFSMVFGHAPIILPAVTGFPMRFHPVFYLHLVLLHLTLALRLLGDLSQVPQWQALGGLGNAAAIAVFVLSSAAAIARGRRLPRPA